LSTAAAVALYRVGSLGPNQLVSLVYAGFDATFPSLSASSSKEEQENAVAFLTRVACYGAGIGFGTLVMLRVDIVGPVSYTHLDVYKRQISGRVSATISRVSSGSSIPNPRCSVVDDPRPVPNSNRPSDRWSSIATRSAMRAGWLTGGVMLNMPEPRWMLDVCAAANARKDSEADRWEYSSKKWCSVTQAYLKPAASAALT